MIKKRSFGKKSKGKEDMSLQITSMADIFTILLVFLLKSFSTDASTITPHDNISLPEVKKSDSLAESLKLEISQKSVLVDDKPISDLRNFQFDPSDLEVNGTPRSLNTVLIQIRKRDTLKRYPKLLILSDQSAPFSTIKRVLASASSSGFEDFKLVVVEDK